MAAPTPNTRMAAHAAVGLAGGAAARKVFGRRGGLLVFLAGLALVAFLHEEFDAPVARAMADLGIRL